MEVKIKACMRELREIWQIKTNGIEKEMRLQHREDLLRKKYGVEIFMQAEERLASQGEIRGKQLK